MTQRSGQRGARNLRFLREWLTTGALVGLCAGALSVARDRVAEQHQAVNTLSDVYALPDPEQLKVLSLGYRSAVADLLFGRTLVAAGMHFSERKVFEHLDGYLHAIVALEPKYRDVYYYADSLLTMSTVRMPERNYRIARTLQEAGLKLFPDDAELWMSVGQYMAYLAVQWLPPEEDREEWRRAGIGIIQQACAIWPYAELPASCLGSASALSRMGETEAAIRSLERLVALADDPDVRRESLLRLEALVDQKSREQFRDRVSYLTRRAPRDLPMLSRTAYQLAGPAGDVEACIGLDGPTVPERCATSFEVLTRNLP